MAIGFHCPWSWSWPWNGSNGRKSRGPKTVSIFLGFFLVVNFCLGTGFLGVPYSFFYAGFPAAIPTLLLIGFLCWNTATWTVEVMARAQAVETYKKATKQCSTESDSEREDTTDSLISEKSLELLQKDTSHPNYEIRLTRKFELTELCEMFFYPWVKYIYLIVVVAHSFLAQWTFSTVAASAWASNIPFDTGTLHKCGSTDFQHELIPDSEGCRNAYRFCLLLFGLIVIPLSMADLKEQAIFQMLFGLMRFVAIGAIVLYCIVKLIEGGDVCETSDGDYNSTLWDENSTNSTNAYESSSQFDLRDLLIGFNWKGWVVAVPIFVYAFILHAGIPTLTHPIRQKKYLRWFMVCIFGVATTSYLTLGITVSWWFRASIQETATLNFVEFSRSGHSSQLRALSYYLILFPSLDVASAFPLITHTSSNNIYLIFMGRDTSRTPKYRFDWAIQLVLKFFVATFPIVGALFISNLVYILKYAGLFGFGICFFFPTLLQLQSQRVCQELFGPLQQAKGNSFDMTSTSTDEKQHAEKGADVGASDSTDKAPLGLKKEERAADVKCFYMTPYSNRIFSHPVVVVTSGVFQAILFLLAAVSLGIHPDKIACQ